MRFGTGITQRDAASWITYATSSSFSLNGTDGVKRVYGQYSGANGVISNVADDIVLDSLSATIASNVVHID